MSGPSRSGTGTVEKIILAEAANALEQLPDNTFDAIVTDPPYGIGAGTWDERPRAQIWTSLYRVLKPGRPLVMLTDDRTSFALTLLATQASFQVHRLFGHIFLGGRPRGRCEPIPAFEPIVVLRKPGPRASIKLDEPRIPWPSIKDYERATKATTLVDGKRRDPTDTFGSQRPYKPHPAGRFPTNVISDNNVVGEQYSCFWAPLIRSINGHPAAKSVELMAQLLRCFTAPGAHILDPFAGGGSTGVAAIVTGRHAVLIERDREFHAGTVKNVEAARAGNYGLPKRVLRNPNSLVWREPEPSNQRLPVAGTSAGAVPRLVSSKAMAAMLTISQRHLRREVNANRIPVVRLGPGRIAYDVDDVLTELKVRSYAPKGPQNAPSTADATTRGKRRPPLKSEARKAEVAEPTTNTHAGPPDKSKSAQDAATESAAEFMAAVNSKK